MIATATQGVYDSAQKTAGHRPWVNMGHAVPTLSTLWDLGYTVNSPDAVYSRNKT